VQRIEAKLNRTRETVEMKMREKGFLLTYYM
jgi:hypothetical protein